MLGLRERVARAGAQRRTLEHVALEALSMLGAYVLVGLPLAWLAVMALPRPASSLDDPPGLMAVLVGMLVAAPLAMGALMQRRRPTAHGGFELLAAALAALSLSLLWEVWLTVSDGEPNSARMLRGFAQLAVLMLPAAWLGGRLRSFLGWLRRRS